MTKFSQISYKRPDIQALTEQFNSALKNFENSSNFDEHDVALQSIESIRTEFSTYSAIASVRNTVDISNSFYESEQNYFDQNEPVFDDLVIRYYKSLLKSNFKPELEKKYGNQISDIAQIRVKAFDPLIIDDLKRENSLTTQYVKLIASASIEFEGKKLNLAGLEPFEQSLDRNLRKKATEAKFGFFQKNKEKLDEIYQQLVIIRHNIAEKLGYKNFIALGYNRMGRTDYGAEQVGTFRDKVVEYVVPLVSSLKERQRKRIELDKLEFWDNSVHFLTGNPTPKGNPKWIIEQGKKMYSELSNETRTFFEFMLENELMDLENKPNKASGGYCTFFSKYKAPFIFSNFNGTSHDIDVLTHEAGHAFQVYESREFPLNDYHFSTSEAAEIHSMSMEFFTWPWMKNFFEIDTDKYKFNHLSSGVTFLPYGCMVDEFQHLVYENPFINAHDRKNIWLELESKYRPHLNYSEIPFLKEGGLWQRQGHIYKSPFYYIDYCLAQICAFQFWSKSQDNYQEAWNNYLKLCRTGGSKPFLELVKIANLESPFGDQAFKNTIDKISTWLNKIDDNKL